MILEGWFTVFNDTEFGFTQFDLNKNINVDNNKLV